MVVLSVLLCATCSLNFTIDGPVRRTRENLELQHKVVESYRRAYGRLPSPTEYIEYESRLIPSFATRYKMATDGWGRSTWICRYGDVLVLRSLGPNGIDDDGGVDDIWIEIEP